MSKGSDLVIVTTRLFEDDLKELRQRADRERTAWQVLLRQLIHAALQANRAKVIK